MSTMEFEPPEHPANEAIPLARITNFSEFMVLMIHQIKVLARARLDARCFVLDANNSPLLDCGPAIKLHSSARRAERRAGHGQSIASAHVSNGAAAAWPTPGTILSVADARRHGSAATAQPSIGNMTTLATRHATSRAWLL